MLKSVKKIIRKYIIDKYAPNQYFSQEGEDVLLNRILNFKKSGFYVDIGSHHPYEKSNTYFFYRKGWNGLNIDAKPGSKNLFDIARNRDINIEAIVSSDESERSYFMFNYPAYNTIIKEVADESLKSNSSLVLEKVVTIKSYSLKNLLDSVFVKSVPEIDFFTIDVEGADLEVLQSNDWEKYRPKFILVEDGGSEMKNLQHSAITLFLKRKGYGIIARTLLTSFFELKK